MTDRPLNIHRHITLIVDSELEKSQIKSWLDCVTSSAPSGIVSTIQTVDDEGAPRAVKLIHRSMKKNELYMVPVSRDMLPSEVEKIVKKFAEENSDIDFDIETHANFSTAMNVSKFTLDHEKHVSLSNALAKSKHDLWMKEKTDDGWRYSTEISLENKTHPLLLPWEQLPDRYKEPDFGGPERLMSLLSDQGYAVLTKDNLEKMVSLLKKVI